MKRYLKTTLYDFLFALSYPTKLHQFRKSTVKKASGTVLEVGSGTGLTFPYYPHDVTHVYAIEPDYKMFKASERKIKKAHVAISTIQAQAEELPFKDNSFDTVISTLVFCTIFDPTKALDELKRVAKEEARFYFLEHVKVNNRLVANIQDVLTPVWKRLAGGCHLNRDTLSIIESNGFCMLEVKKFYRGLFIQTVAKKEST